VLLTIFHISLQEKSFGQQEPKSIAPPEESGTSKSRAVKVLSVEVAQMDAVPFKVAEPETCTHETGPVVAHPEAVRAFYLHVYSFEIMQMFFMCF
jgi:hypothetical protein